MLPTETLERYVASKVPPSDLVRNQERVRRFITEARSEFSLRVGQVCQQQALPPPGGRATDLDPRAGRGVGSSRLPTAH